MNNFDEDLLIINRYVERQMNNIASIEYRYSGIGIKSESYKVSFATHNAYNIFRIYNYGNEFYCHMNINMVEIRKSNDSVLYEYYNSLYNLLKFTKILLDMVI